MSESTTSPTAVPPVFERLVSEGGVGLELPANHQQIDAGEHLAVFLLDDPDAASRGFVPNCVVTELPELIKTATWWAEFVEDAEGPVLLEAGEDDTGFAMTFAQTANGVSITGFVRTYQLPGRTLSVTVQFPSAQTAEYLPIAARIATSVRVEGLA